MEAGVPVGAAAKVVHAAGRKRQFAVAGDEVEVAVAVVVVVVGKLIAAEVADLVEASEAQVAVVSARKERGRGRSLQAEVASSSAGVHAGMQGRAELPHRRPLPLRRLRPTLRRVHATGSWRRSGSSV